MVKAGGTEMNELKRWELERKGTRLHWDGRDLAALAFQYGTPLYVLSRRRLEAEYDGVERAFRSRDLAAEIYFSVKTNPLPRIVEILADRGSGAEIISEYELWLVRKLGLNGDRILVNGSLKTPSLLENAAACGARLINLETEAEVRALLEATGKAGRRANVGLRINPGLKKRAFQFTTASGSSSSPVGFRRSEDEWRRALRLIREHPDRLHFQGLHFHLGSGIRSAGPYGEALKRTAGFLDDVLAAGLRPEVLDIGGGFAIDTLKEATAAEAFRLFVWNKGQEPPAALKRGRLIEEIADLCTDFVARFARTSGIPPLRLILEPGRALCGPAQILLLTVHSIRGRTRGPLAAFCDGGAMSLSPLLLSESHAVFVASKPGRGSGRTYDLFGNLPTPLDLVSVGRRLPELVPADVLAVMDTGAYFTSLGNNFSGPRPAVVLIENGATTLIRRRETFEDLIVRDMNFPEGREEGHP
jgi:diaminopimelate decarboxylase